MVVADSCAARIFDVDPNTGDLDELESLVHPEGRVPMKALTTDRPGRAFESFGEVRHAYGTHNSPARQGAEDFARRVADWVRNARTRGEIDRIVLVAAPAFLGQLRGCLDKPTRRLVVGEFDLNLVHLKPSEILAHLPAKLYEAGGFATH